MRGNGEIGGMSRNRLRAQEVERMKGWKVNAERIVSRKSDFILPLFLLAADQLVRFQLSPPSLSAVRSDSVYSLCSFVCIPVEFDSASISITHFFADQSLSSSFHISLPVPTVALLPVCSFLQRLLSCRPICLI